MPKRSTLPKLCLHKPSGRAVVFIRRRPVYLGAWGSPEAQAAYGKIPSDIAQGKYPDGHEPQG